MPDVTGETVQEAESDLRGLHAIVVVVPETSDSAEPGTVIRTEPTAQMPLIAPPLGGKVEVDLYVAKAITLDAVGAAVSDDFFARIRGRPAYAILGDEDGYMVVNQDQVSLGRSLAVEANHVKGNAVRALHAGVISNYDTLNRFGINFVVLALRSGGGKAALIGYRLSDWQKWGTPRQNQALLGLITNRDVRFSS